MKYLSILVITTLSFFIISCSRFSNRDILDKAAYHLNHRFDSVSILLDMIPFPETLPEDEQASYYLTKTIYERYSGKFSETDSLISIPENYYRAQKDTSKWITTLIFKSFIYESRDSLSLAEKKFIEALELSKQFNDSVRIRQNYIHLIRITRAGQNSFYLSNLIDSLYLYSENDFQALDFLGRIYVQEKQWDRAEDMFFQALKLIEHDPGRYSRYKYIKDQLVELYTTQGKHKQAFEYLASYRSGRNAKYLNAYTVLARGNIWKSLNQFDSAVHYYKIASQSFNRYIAIEAQHQLGFLYSAEDNFEYALKHMQNAELLQNDEQFSVQNKYMGMKYQEEKLKNELNEIKLAKRTRELILVILSTVVILLIIFTYIINLRNKKQKNEQKLKEQAELLEKENQLLKQAEELSSLKEKESALREALFRKMSVLKKIPSLESSDNKTNDTRRIILTNNDWEEIVQTVNESFENFAKRLGTSFPELTDKDIQFCCLIKVGVTLKDLSDIYCVSKAAITKKKFRIKKEKIGCTDGTQSLDDFLHAL